MDHGITMWASAGGVSRAGASTASAPSTVPPSLMVSRGEERSGLMPGFISTVPVRVAVRDPRVAVALVLVPGVSASVPQAKGGPSGAATGARAVVVLGAAARARSTWPCPAGWSESLTAASDTARPMTPTTAEPNRTPRRTRGFTASDRALAHACCHQPSRAVARRASWMWCLRGDRGAGAEAGGSGALGEAALPVRCAGDGGEVGVLAPGHTRAGGVGRLGLGLQLG